MTEPMRLSDAHYALLKSYAKERGITCACALGEVISCPIKTKQLEAGEEIEVPDEE